MDALDIREMLVHVGNNTPCPLCKEKIPSSAIEIIETGEEHCSINFACEHCKEDFSGQIQMKKIPPRINKSLNVSTIVEREKQAYDQISDNEVQAMHNVLEKNISFRDLFGGVAEKK